MQVGIFYFVRFNFLFDVKLCLRSCYAWQPKLRQGYGPLAAFLADSIIEVGCYTVAANLSLQENQADEFQGVHLLAKEMASFNLTCNVTVSGWQSLKLVEVQIGKMEDDQIKFSLNSLYCAEA